MARISRSFSETKRRRQHFSKGRFDLRKAVTLQLNDKF